MQDMGAEPVPGAMQVEGSQGPGLVVAEAQELHWKAVQLGRTRLPQLPERYRSNAPRLLPFVCYLKQLGLRIRYQALL